MNDKLSIAANNNTSITGEPVKENLNIVPLDQLKDSFQSIFEEMWAEIGSAESLTISVDKGGSMRITTEYKTSGYTFTAQEA